LDDEKVIDVCNRAAEGDVVSAVNFNSPGQVVIAGNAVAVERALNLAKEAGAKRALMLSVSVPSHCSLMKPAAEQLAKRLATVTIGKPAISVYNNVDVCSESTPDAICDALKRQLFSPVRWVDTINSFSQQNIQSIVECGPGNVLVGLNKRINRQMNALSTYDVDNLRKAIESVQNGGNDV
jgi:[acyl-carrier-protein] S-malonyltransferase